MCFGRSSVCVVVGSSRSRIGASPATTLSHEASALAGRGADGSAPAVRWVAGAPIHPHGGEVRFAYGTVAPVTNYGRGRRNQARSQTTPDHRAAASYTHARQWPGKDQD